MRILKLSLFSGLSITEGGFTVVDTVLFEQAAVLEESTKPSYRCSRVAFDQELDHWRYNI